MPRTQVTIIGGGPSGMLLSLLLTSQGIENTVLERQTRAYVLGRIRAGVLERGTVDMLRQAGVADRLEAEGFTHSGTYLAARNQSFRVDFNDLIGRNVRLYGQTEVTRDLYEAHDKTGQTIVHEAEDVTVHDAKTDAPFVTYRDASGEQRIDCDYVIGCDGFHGVSRKTIPEDQRREVERVYPFGWLGVLSETPPVSEELIYANSERGFALCSMRNATLSRYYIQHPLEADKLPLPAYWDELKRRIPEEAADTLVTSDDVLDYSLAPLRSFVCEPMSWGRLFLVGDAAHIVPPTGAKGLNLAVSDVHYLYTALSAAYDGNPEALSDYSARALARVWKAIRFSWWFTSIMHRYPDAADFDQRIQEAELDHLAQSRAAQTAFAENYVGLPF